jgi:hypothetical protein
MKRILPLFLLLSSCSFFIDKIDEHSAVNKKSDSPNKFSIVFSHNISGETHPCGCRNFPLGGLPQVAGLFAKISRSSEMLYVDTGDTFFPSSAVPQTMKDSLTFAANNLAIGLEQVGLKYFIPGDQDFAMGLEFLQNLAKTRKFEFLIGNLRDPSLLKNKRFAVIEKDKSKIFLTGLVDPETFNGAYADLFIDTKSVMPSLLKDIQEAGYEKNNPYHRLIILSHAGIENDEILAKAYPFIDWIIGAHSQSFLRFSRDEGNVKMVQTLSKNHYVGDIQIDLNSKKQTDTYVLHEIREELEEELKPNPMRSFIDQHKNKMNDIQINEQAKMGMGKALLDQTHKNNAPYKSAGDCMTCHKVQGDFWQETPHSIAYTTLLNANEANNLSCIGCHSLGLNDPKGFRTQSDMVTSKMPHKSFLPKYWNEVKNLGSSIESVRKLTKEEIKKTNVQWNQLDKKMLVTRNLANVQCLNCHGVDKAHPNVKTDQKIAHSVQNSCLNCHTPDQSPEWYESGIKLNQNFDSAYKKMSCPKSR